MKVKIGILLPRSDMFPTLAMDFLNGLKLSLIKLGGESIVPKFIIESVGNAVGDPVLRAAEKLILIEQYPEDDYTNVATGKGQKEEVKEIDSKAEKLYISMYSNYTNAKYDTALGYKRKHDDEFMGDQLQIKFDYLEALVYWS